MKKIIMIILALVFITGCGNNKVNDSIKFKESYESLNDSKRSISISEDNPFVYSNGEEVINKINDNEEMFIYIGDPKCPWCRSVIEKFISVAKEANVDKVYYVEIWDNDHNEIYRSKAIVNDEGKVEFTVKGTEAYYKLLEKADKFLSDYTVKDKDGNSIKTGEKRLFAPTFIYVKNGEVKALETGISDKQTDANMELSEDILKDEENKFKEFIKVKDACEANMC